MAAAGGAQGRLVFLISPCESELPFPLGAQHRKPLGVGQQMGERVASIFARCCHCHLSSLAHRPKTRPRPRNLPGAWTVIVAGICSVPGALKIWEEPQHLQVEALYRLRVSARPSVESVPADS